MVWTSWLVCSLSRNCTKDSSFLICFVWRENLQCGLGTIQLKEKKLFNKIFSKMPAKNQTLGLLSINDWNIKIEEEGYNLSDFDQ